MIYLIYFLIGVFVGLVIAGVYSYIRIKKVHRYIRILENTVIRRAPKQRIRELYYNICNPEWLSIRSELEKQFKEQE